jgi:hypothetical protein
MCDFISGLVSVELNEISIGNPTSHSFNKVHSGQKDWREFELTKDGKVDIRTEWSDDKNAYLATMINLIGEDLKLNSLRLKYSPSTDFYENKYYWTTKGFHRKNKPAIECSSGSKYYYLNGKLHRIGGPAVEEADGSVEYWVNDKRHREDGPAIKRANGYTAYYVNDKSHREDGPAIICSDGTEYYYLNDIELTKEEFLKATKKDKYDK